MGSLRYTSYNTLVSLLRNTVAFFPLVIMIIIICCQHIVSYLHLSYSTTIIIMENKNNDNDQVAVELLAGSPPFYEGLHRKYITELADKLDQSYEGAVTDRKSLAKKRET